MVIPGRLEEGEPGISRFSDVQEHIRVRFFAPPGERAVKIAQRLGAPRSCHE